MKKALLVLLLLAIVLGVSYYKAAFQEERYDAAYEKALKKSAESQAVSLARLDSLEQLIIDLENNFGGFSIAQKQENRLKLDSLNDLLDQGKNRYAELAANQKNKSVTLTKIDTSDKNTSQHIKVLAYYKKRFADLPTDLSIYEKKVASNEIRQETVAKFSITAAELDGIRKQHNLRY